MSETLYLYREGQKPLKLAFTVDDLRILEEWYKIHFPGPGMPSFKELDLIWKNMFAKSISFNIYKCRYRWRELKQVIKSALNKSITKIKNFFRCTP